MPTSFDGSTLMTKMWIHSVIPEADIHYKAALKESRREGVEEIISPVQDDVEEIISDSPVQHWVEEIISDDPVQHGVEEISSDHPVQHGVEEISSGSGSTQRTIFTFDGCWQQLHSIMTSLNGEFKKKGYEGFKFAAASTMVEQPNDVGHCHKAIKLYFKTNTFRKLTSFEVPDNLWGFDEVMKAAGLEQASVHTYWKTLCHIELCLSKACTMPMVQKGYRLSGIYPINSNTIMTGWSGWSKCSNEQASKVLAKIPELTKIAKINGRVTDQEIESCMAEFLTFDPLSRKTDDCQLNHSRCLWSNNSKAIERYQRKAYEDVMRGVSRDNALMEREYRMESPNEANAEDASEIDIPSRPVPVKLPKMYKCSNTACNQVGSAVDRKKWTGCRIKSCTLLFCVSCAVASEQHRGICDRV